LNAGTSAGWGSRDGERTDYADDPELDPYSFDRRCRIESAFPQIRDAYDLTLEEFADRVAWLDERGARQASGQLAVLHRQMRQWSRGRR
jgi:hypothetical protein